MYKISMTLDDDIFFYEVLEPILMVFIDLMDVFENEGMKLHVYLKIK